MEKSISNLLSNSLWEFIKNSSHSPQQHAKIGDIFLDIGYVDIAKICFSSGILLAKQNHNNEQEHFLFYKLQNINHLRNKVPSTIEQRVVAKSFFNPIIVSQHKKQEINRIEIIRPKPPSFTTLAGHAQWAKLLFSDIIINHSTNQRKSQYIQVLRQFGSYTPLLDPTHKYASGGGYFISCGGYGIVLDPGHNFIQNFLCANHTIKDIDIIIVTHAHDDHMGDLIGLDSLIFKRHESNRKRGPVKLYPSEGTSEFFNGSSLGKSSHLRIEGILSTENIQKIPNGSIGKYVNFEVLPTKHIDISGKNGIGIKITMKARNKDKAVFIYSSDTGWSEEIQKKYELNKDCSLLLLHLGSINSNEIFILDPNSKPNKYLYKNHLGLIGVTRLIQAVHPKKVLIGEFGEELAGFEKEIVEILQEEFKKATINIEPAVLFNRYHI